MARNVPKYKQTRHSYSRDLHVQWRAVGSTGPYVQEPHPHTITVTDSVTYGPNIPDWRLRLQLGLSATTNLSGTRYTSKCSELTQTVSGSGAMKGFGRTARGFNPQGYFPPPPTSLMNSTAERNAASAFLNDYLKSKRTWHGGAAIAEFSETVRMLAQPIDALYNHTFSFVGRVGALRKVFMRDPEKYGKLLGSLWLSYAFGVAPLVDDVNTAQRAVQSLAEDLGAVDTKRLIGTGVHKVVPWTNYGQTVSYANYCVADWTLMIEYLVRYVGSIRCAPPSPMLIAEDFGVGFTDILPSVWEGVPWSWLIDYFVNVNEMLESVSLAYADFQWINRTVRNRAVYQWSSVRPISSSPTISVVASGGQGYYQSAVVNRTPTTVPYPSWRFRIPGLPRQFANVAALVLAIKGSRPRS